MSSQTYLAAIKKKHGSIFWPKKDMLGRFINKSDTKLLTNDLLNLACSRLLERCAKESARGRKRGGNEGEKKRERGGACNHFLKHLMPVYQLPVYPLIGQF